jgi:hypothetical protein
VSKTDKYLYVLIFVGSLAGFTLLGLKAAGLAW